MKTILIGLFVLPFFLIENSFAQGNPEFGKGNHVINLGVGIGGHRSIPLTASYEVAIIDGIAGKGSIGIGGIVGFRQHRYRVLSGGYYTYTSLVAGFRAAFHYNFLENLDTYAGFITAYSFYTDTQPGALNAFVPGAFIGVRYYLKPGFAVMAELGEGITYINAGVAFRF